MIVVISQYHSAYLTSGCFSPTRAGVFFVTRMDGVVDIWDYFYRQNEVAYSHKVRGYVCERIFLDRRCMWAGTHSSVHSCEFSHLNVTITSYKQVSCDIPKAVRVIAISRSHIRLELWSA